MSFRMEYSGEVSLSLPSRTYVVVAWTNSNGTIEQRVFDDDEIEAEDFAETIEEQGGKYVATRISVF